MKGFFAILTVLISAALTFPASAQDTCSNIYTTLSNGFRNPPDYARPKVYWWWLNGNTDTSRMKEEIRAMKNAGISGFDIFEIGVPSGDTVTEPGPAFLSPESVKAIKLAIDEAGKLGMQVGLNMASSWNAGGSWIKPEHSAKSIYSSKVKVEGSTGRNIELPLPELKNPSYIKEVAVIAVPAGIPGRETDTAEVRDISEYFDPSTGILEWMPEQGEWRIYRFVCSTSGEQLKLPSRYSAGLIIDHFDSTATEAHFMHVINILQPALGDLRKTALKSLYLASYEAAGFVWTPTMPAEFRKLNGYEVFKLLPSLFDKELYRPDIVRKFQYDFRKALSELMIRNFYGKAKEIANRYGLKINSEAGGPGLPLHNVPVEPLKALGTLDLPRGEFWINHSRFNEKGIDILRVVKEVSAASHIYNRRIVEEESFTSFQHWQEGPFDMKPFGDRAFCEGLNRVVVHGFSHNPEGTGYPGIVYHAGTHFNDKRVWWPKVKPFNDYLARISYIFQETDFFADVLYWYGNDIPNYAGPKNSRFTAGPGYDYEVINTEILKKLKVRDKKLVLPGGAQFSLMVMEESDEPDLYVMAKVDELVSQGAIITGPRQKYVSYTPEMPGLLGLPPDIDYSDKEFGTLDYIHYSVKDIDFYFVRNTTDQWLSRKCSFRQHGKIPEFWDPVTGLITRVYIYREANMLITLPLTFAPYESRFIVFRKSSPAPHFTEAVSSGQHPPLMHFTDKGICFPGNGLFEIRNNEQREIFNNSVRVQALEGAWEVSFPESRGAPLNKIFPRLISWTESEDPGIRYFSGTAKYRKIFHFDPWSVPAKGMTIFLDPGHLSKVGEIWLNGKSLGITWCEPRRFDVTDILIAGENILEIEISNTWSNRLTGDAITGENYTRTNIRTTNIEGLNNIRVPWKNVPLIQSGLTGPVNLIWTKQIQVPPN